MYNIFINFCIFFREVLKFWNCNILSFYACCHCQRRIQNPVKYLRWSFCWNLLTIFAKRLTLFVWLSSEDCVNSIRVRIFSGPYFPAFGLHTKSYFVFLRIQSVCGKIRTKKNPNTDTFYVVECAWLLPLCATICTVVKKLLQNGHEIIIRTYYGSRIWFNSSWIVNTLEIFFFSDSRIKFINLSANPHL